MQKIVLYTEKGHKVPVDIEAGQPPIICISPNGRYFAASLVEGGIRSDGDRLIYLEITMIAAKLEKPVTSL